MNSPNVEPKGRLEAVPMKSGLSAPNSLQEYGLAGFGIVLVITGGWLAIKGGELVLLGGSPYYLVIGVVLIATGVLIALRSVRGVYLFLAAYVATALWTYWEVDTQFWGWVPRFFPFLVMGVLVAGVWHLLGSKGQFAYRFALLQAGLMAFFIWQMYQPQRALHPDAAALAPAPAPAPSVDSSIALSDDWSDYAHDTGGGHFSPAAQITPENVSRLKVAWTFRTGKFDETADSAATPLQIGNSLFFCTSTNAIYSIDATTGGLNWTYDPKVKAEKVYWRRCRGVGYFDEDKAGNVPPSDAVAAEHVPVAMECRQRIIGTTLDATAFALDAKTGKLCSGFGNEGTVDLKQGMGNVRPGGFWLTSAPLIAKGQIILGSYIPDNKESDEVAGVIRSFSARTGKLLWAWNYETRIKTETPDDMYERRTPNYWGHGTYDEKLGLVYLPTGTATPDYWGIRRRPEDDRFSTSVIALSIDTGRLAWSFQTVHHDLWDYDLAAPPAFVDMPVDGGQTVPSLVVVGKAGQVFVLNRATGEPVTKVVEKPVPGTDMPGEHLAPTQPFSVGMPAVFPETVSEKSMWGVSLFDQLTCRIAFRMLDWKGQYTPPSKDKQVLMSPGFLGGFNWGGVALDTQRNMLILNDIRMATLVRLVPRETADARAGEAVGHASHYLDPGKGSPYGYEIGQFQSPLGLPCEQPAWGKITGIDLATRKIAWQVPAGTVAASTRDKFGLPLGMPMGLPTISSAISTASGVTFFAGFNDEHVRGYDTRTGKELWSFKLPFGSQATPITYVSRANGKQYLVVNAGGSVTSKNIGDQIIAFALPD